MTICLRVHFHPNTQSSTRTTHIRYANISRSLRHSSDQHTHPCLKDRGNLEAVVATVLLPFSQKWRKKSHTTRRRGHLRVAISTVSDPSGSGRVDMLTGPVAAARAVVATGACVKSKHDMYLIVLVRGSVGA